MRLIPVLLLSAALAGCAGVRPQAAAEDLRETVVARDAALPILWRTDAEADREAAAAVGRLLADSLSADAAVQIALLNNPRLQATYEDLGIAQAQLVQAGLLRNPVFGGRALWALDESGAPDLGFNVAFEFLDILWIPMRKRVARAEYEATRYRVAHAVLDHAAKARMAYTGAQADRLRVDLQARITQNARAAYTATRLLREAGTVPAADLLAEQGRYEQARLDLAIAEQAAVESREALARTLGLTSGDVRLGGRLMPVPDVEPLATDTAPEAQRLDVTALERRALAASLPLAAARAEAEALAARLGLDRTQSVLPELEVGAEVEREEGAWEAGPEVEVVLPLFDQGQARRAALWAALRAARTEVRAAEIDTRSAARVLATRLATTRRVALQYQRVLLGLRADLSQETLRQYNAMQTGVFGLLAAQEAEAQAARAYAVALAAYWDTRTDLDALLAGRLPDLASGAMPAASGATSATPAPGH